MEHDDDGVALVAADAERKRRVSGEVPHDSPGEESDGKDQVLGDEGPCSSREGVTIAQVLGSAWTT